MTVLFERHDMKIFPTFQSHDEVKCFHCDADLVSNPIADTDNGTGGRIRSQRDGGWRKHCESCKMFTWYDVEEQIDGIR